MFEYKDEYAHMHGACFNLTDACNLRCRYCFVTQQPNFMSLQVAKDGVDFLVSNLRWKKERKLLKPEHKTKVTYFGGEPMLLYDEIIVPLTLWAEEKYPNEIHFSITTNGTLLNKERIDFLKAHNIAVHLSIDGAKTTQDANRPCRDCEKSSFDMVSANIPYLLENFPNTVFRATIDQNTVGYTFENYLYAQKMGFKSIYMIPNGREKWSDENINILKNELDKIAAFRVQSYRLGLPIINSSPFNEAFKRVKEVYDVEQKNEKIELKISRSFHRCGMGIAAGSIGYDGSLYGCQEQDSKAKNSIFYIGSIYDGIDKEKHSLLLQTYSKPAIMTCEDPNLCDNCKLRKICFRRCCPSTSMDLFGNMHIDNKMHCLYNQFLYDIAEKTYLIFTKEKNPYFNNYISTQILNKKKKGVKKYGKR